MCFVLMQNFFRLGEGVFGLHACFHFFWLGFQIQPPAAFGNVVSPTQKQPLFEALYPRTDGPGDTRHFVEKTEEDPKLFQIASQPLFSKEFTEF